MASQADLDKEVVEINKKWANPAARNGLFGNALKSVSVKDVRGMNSSIEFTWPVIAMAGTNGSGKTTLLQLCSAAYVGPEGGRNYKIGEWVRNALAGETPAFVDGSEVHFSFWNDAPSVSIPYQKDRTRWGYPRRNNPERLVQFFGITTFAPRIERKDRLHVFRSQIEVKESAAFDANLLRSISTILGVNYPEGTMHTVGLEKGDWRDSLPQVKRGEYTYAEPHMGAGEQKVIRLVRALEALPQGSLVLLEEPEITLHPDAQRGLAWYLMSLSRRKGHQIILSTHSSELFEALPSDARVLIVRRKTGVDIVPRAPSIAAARELAGVSKTNKDLILVEDVVAREFLTDILRRFSKPMLDNTCIVPAGNTDDVYRLVQTFRAEGVRAVGVRDPDIGEAPAQRIFSLPGDMAPETLLLQEANIEAADAFLSGTVAAFDRAKVGGIGQVGSKWAKAVFPLLANELDIPIAMLRDRLTLAWLQANQEQAQALVARIEAALA